MTNKKLMKKIAPVVMSAAVAMTSMPYAVLASDFTDSEVLTDSTYGEKSAKLLLLHERKVYLTCFRQLNPSITS